MNDAFGLACRYPDDSADLLIDALAKNDGVSARPNSPGRGLRRDS